MGRGAAGGRREEIEIAIRHGPIVRDMRKLPGLFALACFIAAPAFAWEHWGGDRGGTRFSPLAMITPANVGNLVKAWQFRTGDLDTRPPEAMARTKFQATPLFVENSVIFCSPFNEVIALDPGTGAQKWRFDPKIDTASASGQPLQLPRRRLLGGRAGCRWRGSAARALSPTPTMRA